MDFLTRFAGDDTFNAFLVGNVNSLVADDTINGGAGNDTLFADFLNQTVAQTPITTGIEIVKIRVQNVTTDSANNNIDLR